MECLLCYDSVLNNITYVDTDRDIYKTSKYIWYVWIYIYAHTPPLTSLLPTFKHLLYSSLDKPRRILKCRDITLPIKVCIVKTIVFPVVMYGCESWTIKNAERWRIDAFKLWCWRRLLRVPWTARRANQSILKEISPEYSMEGLMLKLKLQYFGHLIWRANSLEKTLMLGKIQGKRRRGWQRMKWWDSITDSMDMSLSKL